MEVEAEHGEQTGSRAMQVFGLLKGVQVAVCALYALATTGLFKLARALTRCRVSALVASGAYAYSWFMTFTVNFQAYISNFFVVLI